ncbi:PEP-CTERM sorting domain-containing protein [Colwellia sp. MEBiC06753]
MTIKFYIKQLFAIALLGLTLNTNANIIDFETFNIRNHDGSTNAPWDGTMSITENVSGTGFSAITPESGQKVGYGTNAFDGMQINLFNTVNWDKVSGSSALPYLNMWVTDGTNYAVISSENDYRGQDFQARQEWKIFEYTPGDFDWLFSAGDGTRNNQYLLLDGVNVTLADFADNIMLYSGPVGATPGVGTGAPRGGYGFNVIFGDTQANFIGDYAIENLVVTYNDQRYIAGNITDVPEPSMLAIFAVAIFGLGLRFKKQI